MVDTQRGAPLIVGTAGHIDHGKTTLVKALTGQNADRLPEEKARGITIDLGFAHMVLANGQRVAFIDVPGHEKFVRNMVAGVHGMDGVLLVVAADEGIMPQTREHLDILRLLGVTQGITVITKAELVDPEMLELVQMVVREAEEGTFLQNAPMIVVDALTGRGIEALTSALEHLTHQWQTRKAAGPVRLPIDRVFTVKGFGTVVTGTLVSGTIRSDESLELVPGNISTRIRGLEVHNEAVLEAGAGQRVAVNLSGVDKKSVQRGQILATPGQFSGRDVAQVALELLNESPPLKDQSRVHVHSGTAEAIGRLYFFDRQELSPGGEAYAELRLETPMPLGRSDRILIRSYSPVYTIGGGQVLEVGIHHRKKEARHVDYLAKLHQGRDEDLVHEFMQRAVMPVAVDTLSQETLLTVEDIQSLNDPALEWISATWLWDRTMWLSWQAKVQQVLNPYLVQRPLRPGMPLDELKNLVASNWPNKVFQASLSHGGWVIDRTWVRISERPTVPPADALSWVEEVYHEILRAGLKPPHVSELHAALAHPVAYVDDVLEYLVLGRRLYRLEDGLWLAHEAYMKGRQQVVEALQNRGPLSTSDLKDVLGISRKMAVLFLELLDKERVTRRIGDQRTLVS